MKKMIILAASLMIFAGTAVSCGKSGGSSSESDTSSSSEASSGKYTFEEAKKRAGESVRKKAAEALESTTVPPKKTQEDAECDPEAEKAVRDYIGSMYRASVAETLKYMYPEAIYSQLIGTDAEKNFGEGGSEEIEVSDINIDNFEMLSAEPWLETIKQYFEMTAKSNGIELDSPIIVTKACEADVTFNVAANGTADEVDATVIAVNVSGEGWKLIPLESEKLAGVIEDTKNITWE
ncbi:MAG: hypothetical protein J6B01_10890 [Ruminococcus sp.]|nr:hypothetical protein [Ruminococcus sp.]